MAVALLHLQQKMSDKTWARPAEFKQMKAAVSCFIRFPLDADCEPTLLHIRSPQCRSDCEGAIDWKVNETKSQTASGNHGARTLSDQTSRALTGTNSWRD